MSDYYFAEAYFATRDRLSQVIHGILRLADETSTPHLEALPLTRSSADTSSPFRIVACGEVNSGKSSLLNSLFGLPICTVSDLPVDQPILHYQYGTSSTDEPSLPCSRICKRPITLLQNFHLIDTPGTNALTAETQATLSNYLQSADLIICVLSASNPWAAATWNFISTLSDPMLRNLVLVVQQIDQREPDDIPVILSHVADLASKRLDTTPPIFAVSAKLAYQAKQNLSASPSSLKNSGILLLETWISQHFKTLESRDASLKSWLTQAMTALQKIENHIEVQTRNIRDQNHFMDQIEREIDHTCETFIRRLPHHLSDVAIVFEKEAISVTRVLHRKLQALRSLFRLFIGDRTSSVMEEIFIQRIQNSINHVALKDSSEVVDACKHHWQELESRVKASMAVDLTSDNPIDETLTASKNRFNARISKAAERGISNLKVRNHLNKEIQHRNTSLKSFAAMVLIFISAGAASGALGIPWLPMILLGIAALFFCGAVLTAWTTRRAITREFKTRLLDTCGAFANTLHSDYEEALRIAFRDYKESLSHVRDHLAREKLAIEPRLRRWKELFLTLKAIEQEL